MVFIFVLVFVYYNNPGWRDNIPVLKNYLIDYTFLYLLLHSRKYSNTTKA